MGKLKIGASFYLIGAVFLFATIEIGIKSIQGETTSLLTNFFRFFIGGISLLLYAIWKRRIPSLIHFIRKYPKYYLPAALIGLVGGMLLFTYGTSLTDASLSAAIISSNPIMISTYMILFQGEKRTTTKIIGNFLGFFGVVLIITELDFSEFASGGNLLGNLIVFLGTILWVVNLIIGKIVMKKSRVLAQETVYKAENGESTNLPQHTVSSLDYNIVTFMVASLFMVPFLFTADHFSVIFSHTFETWMILLYLGVITTGFAYLLFFKGLETMEASKSSNMFYLKPIFSVILAFLFLNEIPGIFFYIGGGIEIIALLLISHEK
ncbi:MAG: DMT family transporter [Promethearchaeota archaeon]